MANPFDLLFEVLLCDVFVRDALEVHQDLFSSRPTGIEERSEWTYITTTRAYLIGS